MYPCFLANGPLFRHISITGDWDCFQIRKVKWNSEGIASAKLCMSQLKAFDGSALPILLLGKHN